MYDTPDDDGDDSQPVAKLTITYPESLHEEIERQLAEDVADNTSGWFRSAVHTHSSLMTFYEDALAAEESSFAVILGYGNGHEPQQAAHRTSISVPEYMVDRADEAIENGVADSRSEWFRDAALSQLGVQQLAFLAGADRMRDTEALRNGGDDA